MSSILYCFFVLCTWLYLAECRVEDYAIVIDAGSTGSRGFVFHVTIDLDDSRTVTSTPCGRAFPGLSSFVSQPEQTVSIMLPLFVNAANIIPTRYHEKTQVFIKGTAGMRLLSIEEQDTIWKGLVDSLNRHDDNPFHLTMNSVGTIDGHAEAYYAVLASNYIAGSIDGNLHPVPDTSMIGALDMGGSSTQLIFYNGTNDSQKIAADDFWSHSWLNYGVHRIQEKIFDFLYDRYISSLSEQYLNMTMQQEEVIHIPNPCSFLRHEEPYLHNIKFMGTGHSEECFHIIEQVVWPPTPKPEDTKETTASTGISTTTTTAKSSLATMTKSKAYHCERNRPCAIDDIEHPSVHGHHFYAMSVYYYALECMDMFGPVPLTHWPSPTLYELEIVAKAFCRMPWEELYAKFIHSKPPKFTREDQLGDRCFENLYIITILERGFAFDKYSRSITYALEIGGSEVEWTYGFALAEIDFRPHHDTKPLIPWVTRWKVQLLEKLQDVLISPIQNMIAFLTSRSFWKKFKGLF